MLDTFFAGSAPQWEVDFGGPHIIVVRGRLHGLRLAGGGGMRAVVGVPVDTPVHSVPVFLVSLGRFLPCRVSWVVVALALALARVVPPGPGHQVTTLVPRQELLVHYRMHRVVFRGDRLYTEIIRAERLQALVTSSHGSSSATIHLYLPK